MKLNTIIVYGPKGKLVVNEQELSMWVKQGYSLTKPEDKPEDKPEGKPKAGQKVRGRDGT